MAQYGLRLRPVTSSALQVPITLQNNGNLVTVGAPGGPVIFSGDQGYIIPALAGRVPRNIAKGAVPTLSGNKP